MYVQARSPSLALSARRRSILTSKKYDCIHCCRHYNIRLSAYPKNIFACESNIKDGKRVASEILRGAECPTALFCCNDLLAIGALQAAKEEGISIPEQLSIIGFDDTILSTVTNPTLTTIAQPMNQMVKMAFDLLIGSLDHTDDIKQRIVLQPELVIRESTGNSPIK